jgi:hypothetical protein
MRNTFFGAVDLETSKREVVHAHRDYWPSALRDEALSFDRDFVENRKLKILFGDKKHYDEQVAEVVSDYIDLAK